MTAVDTRTEARFPLNIASDTTQHWEAAPSEGESSKQTGLTAPAFEAQKWKPGQSGNPNGRPKSDREYKLALLKRFPPEELADYWLQALQIAIRKEQAANIVKVLIPITEHLSGKPVATTVQVSTKYEQIMAAMQALAGGVTEDDAIEGELTDSENG